MRLFWYFDVSKWSGGKKWCISVLRQNELITTPLFNSSNSDTPENHLECLNMYGCIHCAWCCLRMSWGCLRKSFVVWAVFWGWQSCLGVFCGYLRFSPYRVESCWSQPTNLVQHWNVKKILTWSFWDIKIPKQPHKSFLKIIGLSHFLGFLGSSEIYFLSQLLLITL